MVRQFNQRFIKAYKKLPTVVRLNVTLSLVMYTNDLGVDFNLMLREKRSTNFHVDILSLVHWRGTM